MHLAAAVDAPVRGIFGVGDPGRTAPWGGSFIGSQRGWPDLDAVLARLESDQALAGGHGPEQPRA